MLKKSQYLNLIKKKQILILLTYVLLSCLVVYVFRPVYLLSILIVLLPPALLNFYWLQKSRAKIFFFSLFTTLLFAPPVEIMARLTNAWDVESTLPRLFGIAPLENLIFAFLNFFWVLSFYEYFIDRDTDRKISSRWRYIALAYCLLMVIVFSLFSVNRELISFNYHSLAFFILLVPGLLIFSLKPKLLIKTWLPTLFFALVFFVYELVSLLVGSWWWPGTYLWPVILAGKTFPLDDVVIWYFLSTPVLIGGYEFFIDDGK